MVEITDLRVQKNGRQICFVPSLSVEAGSRLAVIGSNGSGKSTLLRVLGGLETNFRGTCDTEAASVDRVYVHQSPYLFRGTVESNVAYGLRSRHGSDRNAMVDEWLGRLGIEHLATQDVRTLSGGERRRTALARACAREPALLLLDEPFADLDEESIQLAVAAFESCTQATILATSPVRLDQCGEWRQFAL